MSNVIFMSLITTIALSLTACGGGGSTPAFVPSEDNNTDVDNPTYDPCAEWRDDGRNAEAFLTEEYCSLDSLGRLGVSTAYALGYTGKGVKVAVLDSGIDLSHHEFNQRLDETNSASFVGTIYDPTWKMEIIETSNPLRIGELERVVIANSGSNYITAPNITISGDGSGATGNAVLNSSGNVVSISLDDRGYGYSNASIAVDNNGTNGSGLAVDYIGYAVDDVFGHGTKVASVLGAKRDQENVDAEYNDNGMHGVAYDATLLPIKVFLDNGKGVTDSILSGITYAMNDGANIINMSIEGASYSNATPYLDAVNSDVSFVIAAGNDGKDCLPDSNGSITETCQFPAAIPWVNDNSNILNGDGAWIVVGSVDANNNISSFSNRAGVTKDYYLVAPGEAIYTASVGDNYDWDNGTSLAAPTVAGAMALMREKFPNLTGKEIAQIFFDTAIDLGEPGIDDIYGHGLIDVHAAFELAESM